MYCLWRNENREHITNRKSQLWRLGDCNQSNIRDCWREKKTCKECGHKKYEAIPIKIHKDEKLIDANGKQLWKVYVEGGLITFNGTYTGNGYFGVSVLDSNQNMEELVANEVGSYIIEDKMVYLDNDGTIFRLSVLKEVGRRIGGVQVAVKVLDVFIITSRTEGVGIVI